MSVSDSLSKELNMFPEYVKLIGVEPENISPSMGLSNTLKKVASKVEDLVVTINHEVY